MKPYVHCIATSMVRSNSPFNLPVTFLKIFITKVLCLCKCLMLKINNLFYLSFLSIPSEFLFTIKFLKAQNTMNFTFIRYRFLIHCYNYCIFHL